MLSIYDSINKMNNNNIYNFWFFFVRIFVVKTSLLILNELFCLNIDIQRIKKSAEITHIQWKLHEKINYTQSYYLLTARVKPWNIYICELSIKNTKNHI